MVSESDIVMGWLQDADDQYDDDDQSDERDAGSERKSGIARVGSITMECPDASRLKRLQPRGPSASATSDALAPVLTTGDGVRPRPWVRIPPRR